jgi:hypothetical protein
MADPTTHTTCGEPHHSFERLEDVVAACLNGLFALFSIGVH